MQDKQSELDLIIYGSCASRDAYSDSEPGISYVARSSLVSAFSKPFFMPDSAINHADLSPWNRRMVGTDCFSEAGDILRKKQATVALIDLVDERFNVFVRKDRAVTASVQFKTIKGDMIASRRGFTAISIFDDEHFVQWQNGADQLIGILRKNTKRIFLNNIQFSSVDTRGNDVQPGMCEKFNKAIKPYYAYLIYTHGCETIHDIDYSFVVDPDHRWGSAPFHYTPDVYERIRSKIAGVM